MGTAIVPTNSLKFLACCATAGVKLETDAKGISNTYSKDQKYDPDEPGDIHYYLSKRQGINPPALAFIWKNPDHDLQEAAQLDGRIRNCKSPDDWEDIVDDVEALSFNSAIANISLFASGKRNVDSSSVSAEETLAAEILDKLPERMRINKKLPKAAFADELKKHWEPAMSAWIKAWIANYLELRHIWKVAGKSIKIERPDEPFPLIIPKGKDARMLLRRWT